MILRKTRSVCMIYHRMLNMQVLKINYGHYSIKTSKSKEIPGCREVKYSTAIPDILPCEILKGSIKEENTIRSISSVCP